MAFTTRLTFMLVALVTMHLTSGQLYDDWIKTAHQIGDSISMNCSEYCEDAEANGCHPQVPLPEDFPVVKSWLGPAPDLYVWDVPAENTTHNISHAECPSCEILDGGWRFRINSFDPKHHIGIYHCMLYNETTDRYFMVKWGVNMKGPYFEDLLDKYESNIIIGSSSFGGFLFVAFAIILVYKYRWVSEEDETNKTHLPTTQTSYGTGSKKSKDGEFVVAKVVEGKINQSFVAESPPEYNGNQAEAEVHSWDGPGRLRTGSSSSSESGRVRRRDMDDETRM